MPRPAELEQLAASILMVGFPGHTPTAEVRDLIGRGLGGTILFARNVGDPEQTSALCRELKSAAKDRPLLISVDQEGGRVARLRSGFTELPAMRALGYKPAEPPAIPAMPHMPVAYG